MKYAYYNPDTLQLLYIKAEPGPNCCGVPNKLAEKMMADPDLFMKLRIDPLFKRIALDVPLEIEPGKELVVWKHLSNDQFKIKKASGKWMVMAGHDRDHLYVAINPAHPKARMINFNQPMFIVMEENPDWHRESYPAIKHGILPYNHWGKNHRIASHFISPDTFTTDVENMAHFFNLIPLS